MVVIAQLAGHVHVPGRLSEMLQEEWLLGIRGSGSMVPARVMRLFGGRSRVRVEVVTSLRRPEPGVPSYLS